MTSPRDSSQRTESVLVYNLSPELEEELMRRAREKSSDTGEEVAEILENHVRNETMGGTD